MPGKHPSQKIQGGPLGLGPGQPKSLCSGGVASMWPLPGRTGMMLAGTVHALDSLVKAESLGGVRTT